MNKLNCSGSNSYRSFMVRKDGSSTALNIFVNQRCWKLGGNPRYFSSGHSDETFHEPTLQRTCTDTMGESITRALLDALLGITMVVTPQIFIKQWTFSCFEQLSPQGNSAYFPHPLTPSSLHQRGSCTLEMQKHQPRSHRQMGNGNMSYLTDGPRWSLAGLQGTRAADWMETGLCTQTFALPTSSSTK